MSGLAVVRLRAEGVADLALGPEVPGPFDDFGPTGLRSAPLPCRLDETGGLVVEDARGAVAGSVSWHWVVWGPNAASRCPDIGIWLRPEHRGRGLGAAAQAALAGLFFQHTLAQRVQAVTDAENRPEQRALERAGFRREGVLRAAQWRQGGFRDQLLYAVLRSDERPA